MEPEELDNHTLYEIEQLLCNNGSTLKNFHGMPYPSDEFVIYANNRMIHDELH